MHHRPMAAQPPIPARRAIAHQPLPHHHDQMPPPGHAPATYRIHRRAIASTHPLACYLHSPLPRPLYSACQHLPLPLIHDTPLSLVFLSVSPDKHTYPPFACQVFLSV